jgi:transposase-like protein
MIAEKKTTNENPGREGKNPGSKWMCRNCGQNFGGSDGWYRRVEVMDLVYVYWKCKGCGKVYWDVVNEIPAPGECEMEGEE